MGLLEKAVRRTGGPVHPEKRSGLFSKAIATLSPQEEEAQPLALEPGGPGLPPERIELTVDSSAEPIPSEALTSFEEAALVAVEAVPAQGERSAAEATRAEESASFAEPARPLFEEALQPDEQTAEDAAALEEAVAFSQEAAAFAVETAVPAEEDAPPYEEAPPLGEEARPGYEEAAPPAEEAAPSDQEAPPRAEDAPSDQEAPASHPAEETVAQEEEPRDFPLSLEELDSLRAELLSMRLSADYLLACYARIAEAIPFQALGIFLAEGERLLLAASFGFPSSSEDFLPPSLATAVGTAGGKLDSEARALLSPMLGISPDWPIRAVSLLAGGEVVGMWVYSESSIQWAPPQSLAALAGLLAAPAARCKPRASRETPKTAASAELLATVSDAAFASAFVLELAFLPDAIGQHVPGIAIPALLSAVEDGARGVLGAGGAASILPNSRLACLLASSVPLDPELALYQFRKSVKRSLALFEGVELPQGRAIALDLAAEGTAERLAAFLSE